MKTDSRILAPVTMLALSLGPAVHAKIELPPSEDDLVKVILQWAGGSEPVTVFPDGERTIAILSLAERLPTKTELTLWAIGSYNKIEATGPRGDWEQLQEALSAVTSEYAIALGECDSKTECELKGYAKSCAKKVKVEQGTLGQVLRHGERYDCQDRHRLRRKGVSQEGKSRAGFGPAHGRLTLDCSRVARYVGFPHPL